MSSFVFNQDR